MSNQGINALEAFTNFTLNTESGSDPFLRNCPYCHSEHIKTSYRYQTQNGSLVLCVKIEGISTALPISQP
jgi:hypothetical protein